MDISILSLKNRDSRICFIILLLIAISILMLKGFAKEDPSGISEDKQSGVKADSLVKFAKSLMGAHYRYGSCTPASGFDCSGFVHYVFAHFGVNLPRSSYTMVETGKEIDIEEAQKGDLIFFTGTDFSVNKVGHVGIIITDKGQPIEFIHASSSTTKGGVVISSMSSPHYQKRFLAVRRIPALS